MFGMRTLRPTAVLTMIAALVPFDAMFGQTEPNQKVAEISVRPSATLQHNLQKDELEEAKSCLEREGLSCVQRQLSCPAGDS
jgi:hypothetical protein